MSGESSRLQVGAEEKFEDVLTIFKSIKRTSVILIIIVGIHTVGSLLGWGASRTDGPSISVLVVVLLMVYLLADGGYRLAKRMEAMT